MVGEDVGLRVRTTKRDEGRYQPGLPHWWLPNAALALNVSVAFEVARLAVRCILPRYGVASPALPEDETLSLLPVFTSREQVHTHQLLLDRAGDVSGQLNQTNGVDAYP